MRKSCLTTVVSASAEIEAVVNAVSCIGNQLVSQIRSTLDGAVTIVRTSTRSREYGREIGTCDPLDNIQGPLRWQVGGSSVDNIDASELSVNGTDDGFRRGLVGNSIRGRSSLLVNTVDGLKDRREVCVVAANDQSICNSLELSASILEYR